MRTTGLACILMAMCTTAAADVTVPMYLTAPTGQGKPIGTLTFRDTQYGLLILPSLSDLPPGLHGLHVHDTPSCSGAGMGAGDHFDPMKTKTHLGPYADGHLGDLPALYVDSQGKASLTTLAPRLNEADLLGHAVIIHAGGDTYSDTPALGGGGARIACGVIQE